MSTTTTEKPLPAAGGKGAGRSRRGIFGRTRLLIQQVLAEMRKVIWPTRRELVSYSLVVLVFVTIMVLIVALFDFGFVKGAGVLFG